MIIKPLCVNSLQCLCCWTVPSVLLVSTSFFAPLSLIMSLTFSSISLSLHTPQKAGWLRAHPQVSDQPAGAQPRPHRRLQVGRGHIRWHREQVWTPSPTLHGADGSGPFQREHPLNLHGCVFEGGGAEVFFIRKAPRNYQVHLVFTVFEVILF